jgi:nucleoid-associated protein YgaU
MDTDKHGWKRLAAELFLVALLAGCGGAGIAEAERGERGSALYRKAFAAEQAGDIKEAVRLFNRVLVEEPRSFSAHFQLATLLQDHEEDYLGAIYHYKRYLALRPESEKSTLAHDRIRVAEQMLAPQILKKVGDSVQGITQAHLLKENDRLNRAITTLEGEKSVLLEEKTKAEKELASLRGDNERLRDILRKMRVDETVSPDGGLSSARSVGAAARGEESGAAAAAKTDAKALRALRDEAEALAREGSKPAGRKPLVDVPSTESVLKKVEEKLSGEPAKQETGTAGRTDAQGKAERSDLSALSLFGRGEKKEPKAAPDDNLRTYVVQPGDTLFRVAEKFYGDATKWKRIREANRTRIDPDGRIRAGQIIVVP